MLERWMQCYGIVLFNLHMGFANGHGHPTSQRAGAACLSGSGCALDFMGCPLVMLAVHSSMSVR